MRHAYRGFALVILLTAAVAVGCGGDDEGGGNGTPPTLNALGQSLNGNVFAFGQDHTSTDPLQKIKGVAKKMLVAFENGSGGMRYFKVVMDLQSLGFNAYAGKVTFGAGETATFTDTHMCHYSEQTSTNLKGGTLETVLSQLSGCSAPGTAPETYTLKMETVRERVTLFDAQKGVSLTRLYSTVPGAVPAATKPLLGAYQLTGAYYCSPYTPAAYLLLYAAPSGTLRYAAMSEKTPYTGYGYEEGAVTASGGQLALTPKWAGQCSTSSYAYLTAAPVFPPNIRTGDCTPSSTLPGAYNFNYQLVDATCTLFTKELRLTNTQGKLPYMRGPLGFPATTGKGAHYLWGALKSK